MSMRDSSFADYGIVLNDVVDDDLLQELAERDVVNSQFSFTGEALPIEDDGTMDWGHGDLFNDSAVYYISVKHCPSLFNAPYKNMTELVDELYASYNKARERDGRLPCLSEKQVRECLRSIQGTYYG